MRLAHIFTCSASALGIALAGCAHRTDSPSSTASARPTSTAAAGTGSAAGRTAVQAQSGQTRQQVFDRLDTNRDSRISRAEAGASPELVTIFVSMDANSDGSLSPVEFVLVPISFGGAPAQSGAMNAQGGMTHQQVFDRIDTNRDGSISRAEAQANPELAAMFVVMDANSDGTISAVEFAVVPISYGGAPAVAAAPGGTAGGAAASAGRTAAGAVPPGRGY